ncbi:hypothetical protein [Roseobacter sp. CCS2]|uniref:hypothetical protein n=1 Tax=Roseobacter sp. CCS2 TaxID=391593 RepID=UPI00030E307B|nr:hypothetical protein [Roseobacter sp. CCS2]
MAPTDDIDELVSSVRDFVSHKEPPRTRSRILMDRLILTPEQRVHDTKIAKTPTNIALAYATPTTPETQLPPVKRYDKAGLEATIAELEAAVTAQFDDWEADEGESFDQEAWAASAFPVAPNDSAAIAEIPLVSVDLSATDDADAPQLPDTEDPVEPALDAAIEDLSGIDEGALAASVMSGFDEDALRSLVVEIVHDELGGELGERITRNVRKMVRREINRVLTSREMGEG